ncbi:MAG TPA: hypothetical protein PLD47_13770, partial [Aggregatilineales bacterium]|nr:hypothetical protein [Aggregatilineales bacterium]
APWMIPMGIWGLITGGLNLLLGASIWSGRRTGQGIATFLAVIGIIVALGSALTGNGLPLLSLLVNGFVLFYLQGDEARQFFTR